MFRDGHTQLILRVTFLLASTCSSSHFLLFFYYISFHLKSIRKAPTHLKTTEAPLEPCQISMT